MTYVVTDGKGRFLDTRRGEARGWTSVLAEADIFESPGRGKVAFNHATAWQRRYAKNHAQRLKLGYPVAADPKPLPDFEVVEVMTVYASEYVELRDAVDKLAALEAAGVDNWEGYEHAIAELGA